MSRTKNFLLLATVVAVAGAAAGCGGGKASAANPQASSAEAVLLAPEDTLFVKAGATTAGPLITGSLEPDRRADLRAEVPAVVTAVLKENGEAVRKGELLVRLDDTAIRDAMLSAEESERAAARAFEQAERQLARLKTLRESGMVSTQALEDAEIRRNTTQSEVVSAKARAVQARQQLHRTEVRAPFDGVVAERRLSVGDTAQVGKELMKIIDPGSLRLEGLVSADAIASVQKGQKVVFRVNGFGPREFTGSVRRVAPVANAATRQVEVLVDVDEPPARVAGLYAEGRIAASQGEAIALPASAIVRERDKAWAWRVAGGRLQKAPLTLGERDMRSGDFVVAAGLAPGDRVLRHPAATLQDGRAVQER